MIIAKSNPVGVDVRIARLQQAIDLVWDDITVYPRVYKKTLNKKGFTLEWFEGGDYKNIAHAEGNKCFFYAMGKQEKVGTNDYEQRVDVFFMLNLKELYPNIEHRADEEAHVDALKAIKKVDNVFIQSVVFDPETVFSGIYRGLVEFADDLHPYHYFKIELNIKFNLTDKIC